MEGQIEELQKSITERRTQSEVDTQTAAQHAEVMEKVQKLNELMEANKVLTSEKENAEETVRELVMKVCDEQVSKVFTFSKISCWLLKFLKQEIQGNSSLTTANPFLE